MAATYSPKLAQNPDSGVVGGRPSASHQHITMRALSAENIGSSSASRVFEGMLKTTTETGDIGIFSIKPSRIYQPIGSPRKIYHPPQHLLRRTQLRDDGRNMASNAQDASSDILSIYDAASQKSVSQRSDVNTPHYRSYSATYSSSTVSNQRSYTSPTRQMGGNASIQRPRSPFAYPPRQGMRPPRPCFPALVAGDGSSCLPRPEVERLLYEHSPGTSSASPVYYPRRSKPPTPSLRYSGNWSTPSLLGQPLPQHRNSSPNLRHSSVPILNRRENGSGLSPAGSSPAGASPARSNLSLSSVGDPQQDMSLQLGQSIPTKSRSSPLYYDYSEDFSPDNHPSHETPEQLQEPLNDKPIFGGRQVRVDCIEVKTCDDSHQSVIVCPGESHSPDSYRSAVINSRQHSQSGDLQALAATKPQRNFSIGTVDASPNYQYIQPSNLGRGTQVSQVRDDEPSTHVISPSVETVDSRGFALDEMSTKHQFSDRTSILANEDGDSGPLFVIARQSRTLDHENCAMNGSQKSISGLPSAFPDNPAKREHKNPHHSSSFPVTDDMLDEDKSEGQSRSEKTVIDVMSVAGTRKQEALSSIEQSDEATAIHTGYQDVTPHVSSRETTIELDGSTSQLKGTVKPIQPKLFPFSSQLKAPDECKQGQLLQQEAPQNPDPPFELASRANQDHFQRQGEDGLLEYSQALPKQYSYLQISPPQPNGSPDCSSFCSYEECHPFTLQNLDTDSGNELTDFDDGNLPKFRLKVTRPSDSILGTVRVNRASVDSKPFAALSLRDPRDLFMPNPPLDEIFRQPSQHVNAPNATASSLHSQGERRLKPVMGSISNQLSSCRPQDSKLGASQTLVTTKSLNPTDEQSFFSDDSSHMEGKRNLRKTLSNLRARVAIPYTSKPAAHSYDGAHSCDDLSWREEDFQEAPTLSGGNANAAQTGSNVGSLARLRERTQLRRLRKKLSGWIREKRLVISSQVKPGLRSLWHRVEDNGSNARDSHIPQPCSSGK